MNELLVNWLLTYLAHSTLLIGALWALDRRDAADCADRVVGRVEQVQVAGHLGHEQAAVRQERHCPRIVELRELGDRERMAVRVRAGFNGRRHRRRGGGAVLAVARGEEERGDAEVQ